MPASRIHDVAGLEVVDLELGEVDGPGFRSARLLPGRGLMLLQARARLADGREVDVLAAPDAAGAARAMDGGPADIGGNASFAFGAAVLAPYANRIRGAMSPDGRRIAARIAGREVLLPANGGGKAPGAERYAIHGLILAASVAPIEIEHHAGVVSATGQIHAGDFGVGWPSSTLLELRWELRAAALSLRVTARNEGGEALPIGLGWHPYFALPSGRREQARLRVPAQARLPVNDYDAVLPTGAVEPVAGSRFDFREVGGKALGADYLDDCFVELERDAGGELACEVIDPAGRYGVRVVTASPRVTAVQTYAPPGEAFVVVEPQFNWANPYGAEWGAGRETGMVLLAPGETVDYSVRVELFTP
jgi:galactose mutarotase-like enzyme